MQQKTKRIIGWTLSGLVLLFMTGMGAIPKFLPGYQEQFSQMSPNLGVAPVWAFGLVILLGVGLYIASRTRVIGFALLTAYLGGAWAIAWDKMGFQSALMVGGIIVLLWIGTALIRPSLLTKETH